MRDQSFRNGCILVPVMAAIILTALTQKLSAMTLTLLCAAWLNSKLI